MKRLILCAILLFNFALHLPAQELSSATLASPTPKPKKTKSPTAGQNSNEPKEPITTEIYAEHAFFDSAKSIGIFTGHVIVKDPRFNTQSDKLTVYMTKGGTDQSTGQEQQQTLEKAVAEGNVGVVRDAAGEEGGPPQHSVGRSDTAIYTARDGNV